VVLSEGTRHEYEGQRSEKKREDGEETGSDLSPPPTGATLDAQERHLQKGGWSYKK